MRRAAAIRLGLGLTAIGVVWLAGCRCQTQSFDQVFLLDARTESSLPINASFDAMPIEPGDGGSDARRADDASSSLDGAVARDATATPPPGPSLDCTSAAAACTPGGRCAAACDCALMRAQVRAYSVQRCTLLTDGPPAVEARYIITFSGCGD
jgi:hypothetical protein